MNSLKKSLNMLYMRQRESSTKNNGNVHFCDSSVPEGCLPWQPHFTDDDLFNEMDDTNDVSALIPEPNVRIADGKHVAAVGNNREDLSLHSSSSACQVSQYDEYAVTKKPAYGSASDGSESNQTVAQQTIYCVHGYVKGCCVVPNAEIIDNNYNTPGCDKRKESYTTTIVDDHCHQIRPDTIDKKARRKLIIASVLCVLFMIGEVVGGVLSSSLAIATDAAHLLTDFASFMISLFSLWVASRPPTRTMSFGWYRAEVIGALTSVLMIWVVTGILVYLAVQRVVTRDFEIESTSMLITSSIGVLVNIVMGLTLHQHGHSHAGHQHNHEDEHSHSQNINVRAAYIHVIGDFIQSFGVFVAALIIFFKPSWGLVDPICTFLFSILVLFTTFAILKDTMLVLMEGLPKGMDFVKVMNVFLQIDGVLRVHNLRIWALSMDKLALSAHLAISPGKSPQKVLQEASQQIRSQFEFFEMTLQVEEFNENMEQCSQCKCPES